VVFYRYAVKYIPSDTIRIPLKVFSRNRSDGMIRLPTSEEEAAHMGDTFADDNFENISEEQRFHDEDDDIPPPVASSTNTRKVHMDGNEQEFFDVSDVEEEEDVRSLGKDVESNDWRD
jgi:hypothetical protein